jgi:hypothetical protein
MCCGDQLRPPPKAEASSLLYAARVSLDHMQMQVDETLLNLSPGMAVTIEIKTGSRSVIGDLLSPLFRYRQDSLKERRQRTIGLSDHHHLAENDFLGRFSATRVDDRRFFGSGLEWGDVGRGRVPGFPDLGPIWTTAGSLGLALHARAHKSTQP